MKSLILVPFVLLLIPFPAFAIRVLSTGTDYEGWAEGGSIHSEGGVAGASYVPSAHLPHLFSSITVCFRFFEFAVTNGFLVSSDLSPEQAMDDNDYILKVDNRPRADGESKYLGILYQGQFYQFHVLSQAYLLGEVNTLPSQSWSCLLVRDRSWSGRAWRGPRAPPTGSSSTSWLART